MHSQSGDSETFTTSNGASGNRIVIEHPPYESYSDSWHSNPITQRLASYHGKSTSQVLHAWEEQYGRDLLEDYLNQDLPPFAPRDAAASNAAYYVANQILGQEEGQLDAFLEEVCGSGPSEFIQARHNYKPGSLQFEAEYSSLVQRLAVFEHAYALYCNELRSALHMKVRAGDFEMQPYAMISRFKQHQDDPASPGLHFAVGTYTPDHWSVSMALYEGDSPAFDAAKESWEVALIEAKKSL